MRDVKGSKEPGPKSGWLHRSPGLVFYWSGKQLFIHNYLTHVKVAADPVVLTLLDFFARPHRIDQFVAAMSAVPETELVQAVNALIQFTLLEPFDEATRARDRAMRQWDRWGIEARMFHWGTKDVKFVRPEEMKILDEAQARESSPPSAFKRYPRARRISLPPPDSKLSANFFDVLHARRTQRNFNGNAISLQQLATLLGLTWGVDKWVDNPTFGRIGYKTSPSGGARYPIEVYVAAHHVRGLKQGLYHYSGDKHQLHVLRLGRIKQRAEEFCAGQWWPKYAGALFLMTAVFDRTMWRYDYSRALRTIYLEAGHFCQTFCLTATALELAPFCTAAFADTALESALGLDGIGESMLYVAAAGHVDVL